MRPLARSSPDPLQFQHSFDTQASPALKVLDQMIQHLSTTEIFACSGKIKQVKGSIIEAVGIQLPIGSQCQITLKNGQTTTAEVAGFHDDRIFLVPQMGTDGIDASSRVLTIGPAQQGALKKKKFINEPTIKANYGEVPVGAALLGRVVDASGHPLDGLGALESAYYGRLNPAPINPLGRAPIKQVVDVGVRAINSLLTVGRGQRVGIFAGSGVGKSVLLGMMARYTQAQVVVIGLIGERGREVREFIDETLGQEALARSVVVAAPADSPALMRVQAAKYASTIAEYFREQGLHVLLIMDSLTRYAMAHREIALALGEAPATKGYPASVFAKLPILVERAGNGDTHKGSITAFYTVLTEGDDQQDPVADSARAILDGHIVLDRALAEAGHYPAIDVTQSISRVMNNIVTPEHHALALRLKQLVSVYKKNSDLISVGAYAPGHDRLLDEAIRLRPVIESFLQQDQATQFDMNKSIDSLNAMLHGVSNHTGS